MTTEALQNETIDNEEQLSHGEKPQNDDIAHPTSIAQYLRIFGSGFAMGAADIVPGVSGGTMAFIMGVYEALLNAIKSFNFDAFNLLRAGKISELIDYISLRFLIALGTGLILAVLILAGILEDLLINQPQYIFAFFAGLIVASIIAIGAKVRWSPVAIGSLVVGTVVAFVITGFTPDPTEAAASSPLVFFFSGMIAICAMILPGISGSFILLILGQYENVLGAVRNFEILNILAIAAGAGIGLLAFSRVLSWLLKRYENPTIALLVGFMLGSLRLIIFRMTNTFDEETAVSEAIVFTGGTMAIAVVIGIIGFFAVTIIDHLQSKSNPVFLLAGRRTQQSS